MAASRASSLQQDPGVLWWFREASGAKPPGLQCQLPHVRLQPATLPTVMPAGFPDSEMGGPTHRSLGRTQGVVKPLPITRGPGLKTKG